MLTVQKVINSLKEIQLPNESRSLIDSGALRNIQISEGHVSCELLNPQNQDIVNTIKSTIEQVEGVASVQINLIKNPFASNQSYDGLRKVKSIIAISSCKGGVGKSTLAAHLARTIAQEGYKVGLVDADIHGPSVPALFNIKAPEVRANDQNYLIPIEKNGLKIMSFGFLLGDAPAVLRGPIVTRYVQQVINFTDWGELDYLFIDMPPGTGDIQLTITQTIRLTGAVIITTPQTLSLMDVSRGILMFEKVNVPIIGIIENMSYFLCNRCDSKHFIFGENAIHSLQKRFGIKLLAEIPLQPQMTLDMDKPIENDYIMLAAQHLLEALGNVEELHKNVPTITFDDQYTTITWKDGKVEKVKNRDLRLSCRCALCANELTGEVLISEENVRHDITPKEITPLGNYAIGVVWNDGHSSGIYPYQNIKELINKKDPAQD